MKTKSLALARKSALGAAATSAVFGLQHQADAAIVYSGVQNLTASVPPGSYAIVPFNIDSLPGNDLRLLASATANWGEALLFAFSGNASIARGTQLQLKKFASGNIISNAVGGWTGNGGFVRYELSNAGTLGYWASNEQAFGAFRLPAGGGAYKYGWIRLQWIDTDSDGYVNTHRAIDWAYESSPNTAIQAGDTGPVPEPSRALLALAGAGAACLRRKRKQQA